MRHVNVRLDDTDWEAFECLRATLSKRVKKSLAVSTLLRLVVRAGIEANEALIRKIAEAPMKPPAVPRAQWDTYVAGMVRPAAQDAGRVKKLYEKFDTHCTQRKITPHRFREEMLAIEPELSPKVLHKWWIKGEVPPRPELDRLVDAVEKWLEGPSAGRSVPERR
jgi:hypothetical protein